MIIASEDDEITQSVKYLQKASEKVVNKLYVQQDSKRMEKVNACLTDMLISRNCHMLSASSHRVTKRAKQATKERCL